ncbi:MAG: phosphotransferase family protein [Alphaproteobacteria bacterium]|nr:phosphotransferase family protein [Alphaproteobacteria bacterium]
MSEALDRAGPVREGEALDVEAVHAWLLGHLPDLEGRPEVTQYAGGASNWTYRLRYPHHDLVLRRPPAGTKAKSAHDMGREVRVQRALAPVFPFVPAIVGHCEDEGVLGTEFYVMRRVEGLIPRKHMPVDLEPAQARALCEAFVDRLVDLHAIEVEGTDLAALGKGEGYTRRQIEGWTRRYAKARTWNVLPLRRVTRWLAEHTPPDSRICLVHGDYRLDNLVLDPADPTRILAVLDWEMATLGDPLMDLGNSLAYWTQADDDRFALSIRRQPTHLPGMMTRQEVIDRYLERSGLGPRDLTFHQVYGVFRLAVIVQQIYYRYHHRQTRNPAFARFWMLTNYLGWRCGRLIAGR